LANSGSNIPGAHADGVTDALTTIDRIRKFFVANAWDLIVRSACTWLPLFDSHARFYL
jgi:hypothetical protein